MSRPHAGPCEMSRGFDPESYSPRVLYCRAPGIERPEIGHPVTAPIVCDACYARWQARQQQAAEEAGA